MGLWLLAGINITKLFCWNLKSWCNIWQFFWKEDCQWKYIESWARRGNISGSLTWSNLYTGPKRLARTRGKCTTKCTERETRSQKKSSASKLCHNKQINAIQVIHEKTTISDLLVVHTERVLLAMHRENIADYYSFRSLISSRHNQSPGNPFSFDSRSIIKRKPLWQKQKLTTKTTKLR